MKPMPWLSPLVPLYGAVVASKNAAIGYKLIPQQRLQSAVVSIGNLSTGGGGKTPFVIALARLLQNHKFRVDVLSRGFGRKNRAAERVDAGDASTAERYGDEPLLIARKTGIAVYVGRERFKAGTLAEKEDAASIHLLDDGFQHRRLAREFDVVLIHRDDLNARLLPAGHLREPLSSLLRADAIVLRDEDRDLEATLRPYLHSTAVIWHIRRTMEVPSIAGESVAFCGIARPDEFFSGLRKHGLSIAAAIAFPDHNPFSNAEIERLLELAQAHNASSLITTEKDLARLPQQLKLRLQKEIPLLGIPLHVDILEADEVLGRMRYLYAKPRPGQDPG